MNILRQENASLKVENEALKDSLYTAKFALSDLNTKVEDLEHEKASLTTTLKPYEARFKQQDPPIVVNNHTNDESPSSIAERDVGNCLSYTADETILIPDDQPDADNKVCPTMQIRSRSGKVKAKPKSQKDNEINQVEQQSSKQNSNAQRSDKSQSPKKKVIAVLGDSIIKNLQGWRLSDDNNHVVVKSFAGANCTDMEDYLKPVVRKEPENIILHVGTNDLNKSASPDQIAQGIINLGIQINQDSPQTSITISEILPRTDKSNLLIKASQVNDIVKKYGDQNKCGYINHKAINATCLSSKGLHLNKK
ncbi:Scavenger receptor cysteine-rich type 1 M130, partial [Paramuricea clavata]